MPVPLRSDRQGLGERAGTHGSGLAFGPLASQIVAIQVVTAGGELWHVEPTRGLTDPSKFTGRLQENTSLPVSLHQDDATFQSLAVGLGCLGIVYAVVFRAVPKFWLIERRTLTTWEALTASGGALDRRPQRGQGVWNRAGFPPRATQAAVERQFAVAADLAQRGIHHSAPLSLRFVAPSSAYLAMQYEQKTTMMEMGMLVGLPGAEELLHTQEDIFLREFKARPHWGLDRNVLRNEGDIERLYPASWPSWKAVYEKMNVNGTFDGRFTDRVGISRGGRRVPRGT